MKKDNQRLRDYVAGWKTGFWESYRHSLHNYDCNKYVDEKKFSKLVTPTGYEKDIRKLIKGKLVKRYWYYCVIGYFGYSISNDFKKRRGN